MDFLHETIFVRLDQHAARRQTDRNTSYPGTLSRPIIVRHGLGSGAGQDLAHQLAHPLAALPSPQPFSRHPDESLSPELRSGWRQAKQSFAESRVHASAAAASERWIPTFVGMTMLGDLATTSATDPQHPPLAPRRRCRHLTVDA
jgi:hypothetical protein